MKKTVNSLLLLSFLSMLILATGCNTGKDKNAAESDVAVGTGDTIVTAPMPGDSIQVTTTNPADTATRQANQKRKGSVSLKMDLPKPAGKADATDREGYYTNVYPSYPGGNTALETFFADNIEYPQEALDNDIEGTVNISFTVDETGKISAPQVTNTRLGYGLEDEALRVFNRMPKWNPGSLQGKNVKTRYTLPVRFQLGG